MSSSSLSTRLFASLTAGVAGTLVYHFVKYKLNEKQLTVDDTVTIHVEIPRETVAYLVGRDGANIKRIESETKTSISFIDSGGPIRLCVVRGPQEGVKLAEEELDRSVKEYAQLETSEIYVSNKTLAALTAQNNLKIREISAATSARIYIYRVQEKPNSLLVRGVYHQIEEVRNHLKMMSVEEELLERQITTSVASRSTRSVSRGPPSLNESGEAKKVTTSHEKMVPTSSDGFCEVFISSIQDPFRFFVQVVGTMSVELDRLIEEMTELYSEASFREQLGSPLLEVGAYVAAFACDDKSWYRARIVSIDGDCHGGDSKLTIEYLDFGDTAHLSLNDVAKLRPDFLSLRFQAIECKLSGIKPSKEDEWDEQAIETFETLTYCAQWKVIMARIESYHGRDGMDGKVVPCVKLIDTNSDKDVDIAKELIDRKLGIPASSLIK